MLEEKQLTWHPGIKLSDDVNGYVITTEIEITGFSLVLKWHEGLYITHPRLGFFYNRVMVTYGYRPHGSTGDWQGRETMELISNKPEAQCLGIRSKPISLGIYDIFVRAHDPGDSDPARCRYIPHLDSITYELCR